MEQDFYTYELIDPRNNIIFYVGKGTRKRMYDHYRLAKNNSSKIINRHLYYKLKQLIDENIEPIYNKILESNNEKQCYQKEIDRIKEIGIENLCNLSEGGEGLRPSQEIRKKISKNTSIAIKEKWKDESYRNKLLYHFIGNNNPFYNKKHTQESKDKISNKLKNRKAWNKGLTKNTDDRVKKYSESLKGWGERK